MKNYVLNFEGQHKVAISYSEETKPSTVINFIKELANRYYPQKYIYDIKSFNGYYKIISVRGDIYVYIEEIESIFSL